MAPEGQRGRALRVLIAGENGRRVSAPRLARWLARVAPARARGAVGVALVGDSRVRALNKRYRRRDYATDVLSFPAATALTLGATKRLHSESSIADPYPYLGDIVIAQGVARRQARAAGHSEHTELCILALHGLLHLLGYDHERDRGVMARVERALRVKGGLREGLLDRGRPVLDMPERAAGARGSGESEGASESRRGEAPRVFRNVAMASGVGAPSWPGKRSRLRAKRFGGPPKPWRRLVGEPGRSSVSKAGGGRGRHPRKK